MLCASLLILSAAHGTTARPLVQEKSAAKLIIRVTGFPDDRGSAGVALWNAPRGFPEDVRHAIRATYVPIRNRVATTAFEDVAPGVYAVTVLHDRNDNRKLDKNAIGMPKEAWGVSNNARPRLRAPRFDEARVRVDGDMTIEIRVGR